MINSIILFLILGISGQIIEPKLQLMEKKLTNQRYLSEDKNSFNNFITSSPIYSDSSSKKKETKNFLDNGQYTGIIVLSNSKHVKFPMSIINNEISLNVCNKINVKINYVSLGKISTRVRKMTKKNCVNHQQSQILDIFRLIDSYLKDASTILFYNSQNRDQNIIMYSQNSLTPAAQNNQIKCLIPDGHYKGLFTFNMFQQYKLTIIINQCKITYQQCKSRGQQCKIFTCNIHFLNSDSLRIDQCVISGGLISKIDQRPVTQEIKLLNKIERTKNNCFILTFRSNIQQFKLMLQKGQYQYDQLLNQGNQLIGGNEVIYKNSVSYGI